MATPDSNSDTITIQLTQGYVAVIDVIDEDLANYKWHAQRNKKHNPNIAYAQRNIPVSTRKQRIVKMHRIIVERKLGRQLEKGEVVDHIDGNPLNNRRANLRVCSPSKNAISKRRYEKNKSGYKGVYQRETGKYRAQIQIEHKKITLGQFDTPQEAYEAYCEAARRYHGEFARFD